MNTNEFATLCNDRMKTVDKLEKAINNSDINSYMILIHQLKFIDEQLQK